jgi:hypothetical protein
MVYAKDNATTGNYLDPNSTTSDLNIYYEKYVDVADAMSTIQEAYEDYYVVMIKLLIERKRMFLLFKKIFIQSLKIHVVLISCFLFLNLKRKTVKSTTEIRRYKQSKRR